jgi:hypothetical protein
MRSTRIAATLRSHECATWPAGEDAIGRLDACVADPVQTYAANVALTAATQLICRPHAFPSVSVRNQAS